VLCSQSLALFHCCSHSLPPPVAPPFFSRVYLFMPYALSVFAPKTAGGDNSGSTAVSSPCRAGAADGSMLRSAVIHAASVSSPFHPCIGVVSFWRTRRGLAIYSSATSCGRMPFAIRGTPVRHSLDGPHPLSPSRLTTCPQAPALGYAGHPGLFSRGHWSDSPIRRVHAKPGKPKPWPVGPPWSSNDLIDVSAYLSSLRWTGTLIYPHAAKPAISSNLDDEAIAIRQLGVVLGRKRMGLVVRSLVLSNRRS